MRSVSLSQTISQTLVYSHQFQYALTAGEIHQRLIGQVATLDQVTRALLSLVNQKKVITNGQFFGLKKSSITTRQRRAQFAQAKWPEVDTFLRLIEWLPWIKGVAITGSLAVDNLRSPTDDVDFLIVTQPQRLWLTRLIVTAIAMLKGKRRTWHGEEQNSWCFNLWLDTNHLQQPAELQTLYGAYEVIQARWVLDRGGVASQFWHQNVWLKTWLPNVTLPKRRPLSPVTDHLFWSMAEKVAYAFQLFYMKPHITREKIGLGLAYFHPRDTQGQLMKKLAQTKVEVT